jgi:hypothetical protein
MTKKLSKIAFEKFDAKSFIKLKNDPLEEQNMSSINTEAFSRSLDATCLLLSLPCENRDPVCIEHSE